MNTRRSEMTKDERKRKYDIINKMCSTARHNGKDDDYLRMISFAERLHRLETTLTRLAEDECNYPEYDWKKQDRIEKLAEKLIAEKLGCKCFTQRDPRGYAIRMYLVDDEGKKWFNTWDGETTGLAW